jgi:pimeloyl-ACP methyl ester carboxylesterase
VPILKTIHYQVFEEPGALHAVVLLHGAGGSHLSWPVVVRRLPGARVFALDLPGHGGSAGLAAPSVRDHAGRVLDWMQAARLQRAMLVGHSLGGAIALTVALERPECCAGLALLGSAARLPVNPGLIAATASPEGYPIAVEKIVQWSFTQATSPSLRALVARRLLGINPSVMHADLLACDGFDVSGRLADIRCPVLVLCGSEDRMTPLPNSQVLAESVYGARLEVIAGAGHMLMLEKPLQVAEAVGRFLASEAFAGETG